jgi:hypothetical protein
VISDAGREIVARYCLRHRSGLGDRAELHFDGLQAAIETAETLLREPVPVG